MGRAGLGRLLAIPTAPEDHLAPPTPRKKCADDLDRASPVHYDAGMTRSINRKLTPAELAEFLGVDDPTDISDDLYEDYERFLDSGLIPTFQPKEK